MREGLVGGVIGFFAGAVVGGYFVGRMLGKRYKQLLAERDIPVENESEDHEDSEDDFEFTDWNDPFGEDDDIPDDDEKEKHLSQIHMIDAETFQHDIDRRDNETLTYYQGDGVLVDYSNNVIKNEEDVIGSEAMDKIFDCGEGEDYFYVVDEQEDKMYEIVVEHEQSFYRDIMGG